MFRFIAFGWNAGDAGQRHAAETLSSRISSLGSQWQAVLEHGGLRVWCADARERGLCATSLPDDAGILLGTAFERCGDTIEPERPRRAVFDARAAERIIRTEGRELTKSYWGNYIAILRDSSRERLWVIKDPTGSLPCFFASYRGGTIVFSRITDCLDLKLLRFSINWSFVRHRAAGGGFDQNQNALEEVSQVKRGERVQLEPRMQGRVGRSFLWNPLDFSAPDHGIEVPEVAAGKLLSVVQHCVHSWASCHEAILQRLSGGLDSSILISCLKNAPTLPALTSYTYYDPHRSADERCWARLAVTGTNSEHLEFAIDPTSRPLEGLLAAEVTPEPVPLFGYYVRRSIECDLAETRGCTAVFSGEGGDSGFGSECIGLAVDDYLARRGLSLRILRIASQIGSFRDLLAWNVVGRATWSSIRGGRMDEYNMKRRACSKLVTAEVRDMILTETQYPHSWFEHCSTVPWRTIRMLGALTVAPEFYDPFDDGMRSSLEHVAPLYSQPVVETCLRIPIYVHFHEGRERGLARRAFAGMVPEKILQRQWKDSAPGFFEQLTFRNRNFIRELLLDGALAREGVLDRDAIELTLAGQPDKRVALLGEIFNHVNTEIWLRGWCGHLGNLSAAA